MAGPEKNVQYNLSFGWQDYAATGLIGPPVSACSIRWAPHRMPINIMKMAGAVLRQLGYTTEAALGQDLFKSEVRSESLCVALNAFLLPSESQVCVREHTHALGPRSTAMF